MNQEPSAQARRAAEAVLALHNERGLDIHFTEDELAEIIERETGAGEAIRLLEKLTSSMEAHAAMNKLAGIGPSFPEAKEARAFLAGFKQD